MLRFCTVVALTALCTTLPVYAQRPTIGASTFQSASVTTTPLTVQAAAGQSADLLDVADSTGKVLLRVNATGVISPLATTSFPGLNLIGQSLSTGIPPTAGYISSDLSDTGLYLQSRTGPIVFQANGLIEAARFTNVNSFVPGLDDAEALGSPTNRWQNLYLGNFAILGQPVTDLTLNNPFYVAVGSGSGFAVASAEANASVLSLSVIAATYAAIASSKTNSGTYLPLALFTNGAEVSRFLTTGQQLLGASSTDLSIGTTPGFIAIGNGGGISDFVAASAATNASVMSLGVVAGSFVSLASNKTGSGTYLPIDIELNGAEKARFLISGQMLLGGSSTDLSVGTTPFFVTIGNASGFASATATSNAETLSFAIVSSDGGDLSVARTGSGSFLPFKVYTNSREGFRVDTSATNAVCVWVGSALHRLTLSSGNFIDGGVC